MATLSHSDSKRMYSWWWNSHISPKNSKWLQENLTDMDVKVKAMIKLIEEDADSFARRAEMYYKKRPELMKLVEEFYRAYRALAERYDHATGALRQAHLTMAEAFPNQIPLIPEDSPEVDARTPEMKTPSRTLFDPFDLHKGAELSSSHFYAGKRNGTSAEENSKHRNDVLGPKKFSEGRVRKGLDFNEAEEDNKLQARAFSESEPEVVKSDKEVLLLKEALAKLESQKEASLTQHQQILEKLTKFESEEFHAQESMRELAERARKSEAEAQTLKETLSKFEAEKENSLLLYQQYLDRISALEDDLSSAQKDAGDVNKRAMEAENKVQKLKQELADLEVEKQAALDQHSQSLEMLADLEKKLLHAEEEARRFREGAEKSEKEREALRQAVAKLTEEKEAEALLYRQCLERISILEQKLSLAAEEAKRLNGDIDSGLAKLKCAEEQCLVLERSNHTLRAELEALMLKMGYQSEELTEKQKELGRLWTCIQEERFRFVEAETAFQALQHLHSQTQDELRSLAAELQTRVQISREAEACNRDLLDEILKHQEENKVLGELNLSSANSMKELQNEVYSLRECKEKLEEEVELRLDERNALQQEIYCLKEELKELDQNHQNLKEDCLRERSEKLILLEKLEIMGQLLDKNSALENSLTDLGAQLEGARQRITELEELCQTLLDEKSALANEKTDLWNQLQVATESLGRLSDKNTVLENSLSDTLVELEVLREKSKTLEDSSQLLIEEKSVLVSEKGALVSQLEISQKFLKDLEIRCMDLGEKYSVMEKERESTLRELEELRVSLAVQKQEHASFSRMSQVQLAGMKDQIHLLQEEIRTRRKEFEVELDKALNSHTEIFIFQRCLRDLEEKNFSLFNSCKKLLDACKLSQKIIHELKKEKAENQDENWRLSVVTSIFVTLLWQLRIEAEKLETEKHTAKQELSITAKKLLELQHEAQSLVENNEGLKLKVSKGDYKEELLNAEIEKLRGELLGVQGAYRELCMSNSELLEEKSLLKKDLLNEQERSRAADEENLIFLNELLCQKNLSIIFRSLLEEKSIEIRSIGEDLERNRGISRSLEERLSILEGTFEELQMENFHLKEKLRVSENELEAIVSEKTELYKTVSDLKMEHDEALVKKEEQAKQVSRLTQASQILELELRQLREEHENTKDIQENLTSEFQKKLAEVESWETQAEDIYSELQASTISQAVYGEKFGELTEACVSLQEESCTRDVNFELLKARARTLESENKGLKAQLAAYAPALSSLVSCVSSLENRTCLQTKIQKASPEEEKSAESVDHHQHEDHTNVVSDISALHDLESRVRAIESAVIEMERIAMQENSSAHAKLDAALSEIEDFKSRRSFRRRHGKPTSEISEAEIGLLSKDIMLDQASERSSYRIPSRREQVDGESKMLQLWETVDPYGSVDLTVGRSKVVRKPTSEYHPADSIVEKELGVDKLQVSKRFKEPREELNKTKVLERLDSDVQKLMNLHITVQDLKRKLEAMEKGKKGKSVAELYPLKMQLEESEEEIMKLFDLNGKVKKNIDNESFSPSKKSSMDFEESGSMRRKRVSEQAQSSMDFEESGSMRRKRVSEQARRVSEKIGRLQLEIQRMQFVLLKFEEEKENKARSKILDVRRRVILKDYLYGTGRASPRRKKSTFCSCVEPATKGD